MIAPIMEYAAPPTSRAHAAAIRRAERQPSHGLGRFIEKHPEAIIAAGVIVGIGIGWLVKRKKWSS